MNFKISVKEGKKFSELSGDNNLIHLDDLIGYNSIFGEKICYGCLVALKIFKIINLRKIINNIDKFSLKIIFFKHFSYNKKIKLIKKKYSYKIFQQNLLKAELRISNLNKFFNYDSCKKKYSLNINKKLLQHYNKGDKLDEISITLNNLSKYVGTVYPGENSIIREININYNKNFKFNEDKIDILSKKINERFPIINNKIKFKKYLIEFQTLERPIIKKKNIKLNNILKKRINKIQENVLIIGGSQGIGSDVFNILRNNKKIFKIVTYYKNKINLKDKKIVIKKIDIEKNIKTINQIISNYSPIKIFYFPTKKIFFDNKLEDKIIKDYKKIFLLLPLKLLDENKSKKISFVYPSTLNIDTNKNSIYSKIKLKAEEKISKLCLKRNIPLNIIRFPAINSRQSVSLTRTNPPNLTDYLGSNKSLIDGLFSTKYLLAENSTQ